MFTSTNLKNFGYAMKQLRNQCKLTQSNVSKRCGINCDTLRKIENGIVIPKYETLELLSKIYKVDTLQLLAIYRENQDISQFYSKLDQAIIFGEVDQINDFSRNLELIMNQKIYPEIIDKSKFNLLKAFVIEASNYFDRDYILYSDSIERLVSKFKEEIAEFELECFHLQRYDSFEIRVLLLIGLFLVKDSRLEMSNSLLEFCLNELENSLNVSSEVHRIIIKLYLNLSYNYHRLDQDETALRNAKEGINYAVKISTLYCLPHLFARKAVAEYKTSDSTYIDSFKKCIYLFEVSNNFDLANQYRTIAETKYKIKI